MFCLSYLFVCCWLFVACLEGVCQFRVRLPHGFYLNSPAQWRILGNIHYIGQYGEILGFIPFVRKIRVINIKQGAEVRTLDDIH